MINDTDKYYRPCVGAMIINNRSEVWLGKRINKTAYQTDHLWQMPQGGIDPGENPEKAVFREVYEETGLKKLKIISISSHWYRYEIPKIILNNMKGNYIGQTQKWFLLHHTGEDAEVNLIPDNNSDLNQEFTDWKWESRENILDMIIDFKKQTYIKVLDEFKGLLI
ncbi:MAG: RNA pyrophosphohydrolase [Hyphomicrobiales bacterium]|jgi:putative (di)nucleoside polyphosphate hydrolase|nr:RNA pyrophosphohydrolase [Hyphomicrobiales bacterium]|tara:strand:- start:923 stop:1420 length:498 start_codon:yes stop_codon:yes gene_type:complete